ncbi:MAG: hypothetical protein B6U95_00080 [Thermofilum sp. ex4484_82]|nr:MAG: hypothetical protein B6U95_00080 [Thermofilum sp. ex4484_82]OYT40127.1 MAG: hypothetical protein B6U96_00080 [Archaeoglobales archaeon ex4484_92]
MGKTCPFCKSRNVYTVTNSTVLHVCKDCGRSFWGENKQNQQFLYIIGAENNNSRSFFVLTYDKQLSDKEFNEICEEILKILKIRCNQLGKETMNSNLLLTKLVHFLEEKHGFKKLKYEAIKII